jgi:hypothetical protein
MPSAAGPGTVAFAASAAHAACSPATSLLEQHVPRFLDRNTAR